MGSLLPLVVSLTLGSNEVPAASPLPPPVVAAPAGATGAAGFQNTKWGMSPAQVRKLYPKGTAGKGEQQWIIEQTVAGRPAIVVFGFHEARLRIASVIFRKTFLNATAYLEEYNSIRELLTKKYGQPVDDDELWSESLYEDMPEHKGTAVLMGHLRLRARWRSGPTLLALQAQGGEDFKINVSVTYVDEANLETVQNAREEKLADDL